MAGFKLWFGKHAGQLLEQLAFTSEGYTYIVRFLLETLVQESSWAERIMGRKGAYKETALYRRARLIRDALDSACVVRLCDCGHSATHTECVGSNEEGFHFTQNLFCEECKPDAMSGGHYLLTTRFSEIVTFVHESAREVAMRHYRWLIGKDGRMMAKRAIQFFSDRSTEVEMSWVAEKIALRALIHPALAGSPLPSQGGTCAATRGVSSRQVFVPSPSLIPPYHLFRQADVSIVMIDKASGQ